MPKQKNKEEANETEKLVEETIKKDDIKEELKEKSTPQLLVPLEEYIKVSVHTGTRSVSPTMKNYVYRRKADGVAILNTNKIDEKIKVAQKFMQNYEAKDIVLVCRRDTAWGAAKAFEKTVGVKVFLKYPPGVITNTRLENFFEPKLIIICDPYLDRNILNDAIKAHIPVIGLCGSNNNTKNIDLVIPCNNKTEKSIGLVLYLLAKAYNQAKGINVSPDKEQFYNLGDIREIRENRERKKEEKEDDKEKLKELVKKLKEKKKENAKKEENKKEKNEENVEKKIEESSK